MAIVSSEAEAAKFRKKVETSTCCTRHFLDISHKKSPHESFSQVFQAESCFVSIAHCKLMYLTHVLRVSPRRGFHSASVLKNPIKPS